MLGSYAAGFAENIGQVISKQLKQEVNLCSGDRQPIRQLVYHGVAALAPGFSQFFAARRAVRITNWDARTSPRRGRKSIRRLIRVERFLQSFRHEKVAFQRPTQNSTRLRISDFSA
jgi:hypothetical protein